ncbi:MAG: hypothetical protein VX938_05280, partial [Myxococcota bacterium]|nr:hypothetical protein [Myxococcota bacterium]
MSEIYRTVSEMVRSANPEEVNRGLGMARDFRVPLELADHERLLRSPDSEVVTAALEVLNANQTIPTKELTLALLEHTQTSQVLCAIMRLVPQGSLPVDDAVRKLATHDDETVSAHAVWWLRSSLVNTRGRAKLGERVQARRRGVRLGPTTRQVSAVLSEGGGMADELTDRYVYLVDKIPTLMNSDSEENRRLAMEMLEELGLPEHAQMLITGLDRAATRGLALMALKRMPPDVVLPQVFMGLRGSDDDAPGRRIHLLLLAEAIGGDAIAHVIAGQMNASAVAVRDQAVKSLWRLSRDDPRFPLPERTELVEKVTEEIQHLVNYALFGVILAGSVGRRQRVLRRELQVRRNRGEDRVFRLLAMIYAHEPIERAHRNYRKANRRTRSNAIELLDTTISDAEIKPFVDYVEGSGPSRGQTVGQGITAIPAYSQALQKLAVADEEADPVEDFLGDTDKWLLKVYRAAVSADKYDEGLASGKGEQEMGSDKHDDVMERLFLLRGVELFE